MKYSEQWLKSWVDFDISAKQLGERLTFAGFELESLTAIGSDWVLECAITANRGDCLSIRGMAREVRAILDRPWSPPVYKPAAVTHTDICTVVSKNTKACPRYLARVITDIDPNAKTPDWILTRLQSAGLKCISFIVDIANYVMLECGQPLHAFNRNAISQGVELRLSANETVTLLDGNTVTLDNDTCVIADAHSQKVLALAGVMGCLESAIQPGTTSILLESAYFSPSAIRGRARRYHLTSDAATRFERGVDPQLPEPAIERATELILEYGGGKAGPLCRAEHLQSIPSPQPIDFSLDLISRMLGVACDKHQVQALLQRLEMDCVETAQGFRVTPPSFRFDIQYPQDLVEELARIWGYEHIPEVLPSIIPGTTPSERAVSHSRIKTEWVDRGYQEVITYSFIDEKQQALLFPDRKPIILKNPMAQHMNTMRCSLWPGLLTTVQYNQARQCERLKIFEIGQCFAGELPDVIFTERLGGLIAGETPAFWQGGARPFDFYDLKGDIESFLGLYGAQLECRPLSAETLKVLPLHPGQSASLWCQGDEIGVMGALHPRIFNAWDLKGPIYVFELDLARLPLAAQARFAIPSKFPSIRRDLAFIVDAQVSAAALEKAVHQYAGSLLSKLEIFDVYQGEHIEKGKKSVALGLILQHSSRTLIEEEIEAVIEAVKTGLKQTYQTFVRE